MNLESTKQRRTTRAEVKSPLRGLIVDDLGRVFEPVHTTKGGRRYRYYVSRREDNARIRTENRAGFLRSNSNRISPARS